MTTTINSPEKTCIFNIAFVFVGVTALVVVGCVEEDETTEEQQRILPSIEADGESECDIDEAPHEDPSLEAWLAGADANIIGDIEGVEEVSDPLLRDVGNAQEDWQYEDSAGVCSSIQKPLELELTNVDLLHGEDLSDSEPLKVRVRTQEANSGIFPGSTEDWADVDRIGLALNDVADGEFYVEPLRMFEVFDEVVYPQPINEDIKAHMTQDERCPLVWGWGAYFPDEFDGVSVSDLKDEIAASDVDIGTLTDTNDTVDQLVNKRTEIQQTSSPKRYVGFEAICLEDGGGTGGDPNTDDHEG